MKFIKWDMSVRESVASETLESNSEFLWYQQYFIWYQQYFIWKFNLQDNFKKFED